MCPRVAEERGKGRTGSYDPGLAPIGKGGAGPETAPHRTKTTSIPSMRFEGILKSWNEERGFGFIQPAQGGQDIFVHVKAFSPRVARPVPDLPLSFEIELGPEGKKRARNVQVVRPARAAGAARAVAPKAEPPRPVRWGTASRFAIPAFLLLYVVAAALWEVPGVVLLAYLAASVACFVAYAADKSAAKAGRWRTPESTLLALGLAGGWPGAIVAQQVLRHKSSKASFRAAFWVTVVANVAGFVLLSSPVVGWKALLQG